MNIQQLEVCANNLPYESFRKGQSKIDLLSLENLRVLIAYEFWSDGMDNKDVVNLWEGSNELYQTRVQIMNELVNTFNY